MSQSHNTRQIGQRAEQLTANELQRCGYKLICSNYAVPGIGEIDLVMIKNQTLFIIEVKARREYTSFGGTDQAITPQKTRRLLRTAHCFCRQYGFFSEPVVLMASLVSLNRSGHMTQMNVIPF